MMLRRREDFAVAVARVEPACWCPQCTPARQVRDRAGEPVEVTASEVAADPLLRGLAP